MQDYSNASHIALISGAGSGICAEVGQQLANKGIKLLLIDKDAEVLAKMSKLVHKHLAAPPMCIDVTQLEQLENVISKLPKEALPDILINGVGGDTRYISIEKLQTKDYSESFVTNFLHIPTLVQLTVGYMKSRGWGRIINFASIAGRTYTHFSNAAYVSSKAAIIGYTKQSAYELAPSGITVNCVAHGPIMTERISRAWNNYDEQRQKKILEKIPMGRLGSIKEAASIIVHLTSEESGYTTGAIFDVNGGLLI
ncbi:3-oxoacyl-[acyl-carrier-protein] reductase [Scytonema sp. NUACC21]